MLKCMKHVLMFMVILNNNLDTYNVAFSISDIGNNTMKMYPLNQNVILTSNSDRLTPDLRGSIPTIQAFQAWRLSVKVVWSVCQVSSYELTKLVLVVWRVKYGHSLAAVAWG